MRKVIEMLEEKGSLREIAKELDIPPQNLSFWKLHAKKQREFLEALERIRLKLKISKSKMWELLLDRELD